MPPKEIVIVKKGGSSTTSDKKVIVKKKDSAVESSKGKSKSNKENQEIVEDKPQRIEPKKKFRPRKKDPKLDNLLESLTHSLTIETYECMVCYENIRSRDKVWSCETCFAVFHIKCINQWAEASVNQIAKNDPSNSAGAWRCPGCQNISQEVPRNYDCFCGKTRNPQFNRYTCPHTCGSTCAKDRGCAHKCPLQCHPGPCPPCDGYAKPMSCACMKGFLNLRCSQVAEADFTPSCGQNCDKLLNCGIHSCVLTCHYAPCPKCKDTVEVGCFCGQDTKQILCGEDPIRYSCGKKCPFIYNCGVHECQEVCHEYNHENTTCPLDPSIITHCPCGKVPVAELSQARTSCQDSIPVCGNVCEKEMLCGHKCQEKCHLGECPPCELYTTAKCRCFRHREIVTPCKDLLADESGHVLPVLCDRICKIKMSCKNHVCNTQCCVDEKHECHLLCGKTLSCSKHTCLMTCGHEGPCHDCLEGVSFEELTCHCGRTVMYPPIPCNTAPPECNQPCRRVRPCGHINNTPHYCHTDSEPCPPCMIFTEKRCACGDKIMKNIPCSRQTVPSCGGKCKINDLKCAHSCSRVCHDGPCIDANHPCTNKCGQVRSCGHVCKYSCHGTLECPETSECKEVIIQTCECGNHKKTRICGASVGNPPKEVEPIPCDDACLKKQRAEKMAAAMEINPANSIFRPLVGWAESLVRSALGFPTLVLQTEKILEELVSSSTTVYYFPQQRLTKANSLIADMCTQYGYKVEIVDEKIGKGNVIARKVPGMEPAIPPKLLSVVAKEYNPNDPMAEKYIIKPLLADVYSLPYGPHIPNALYMEDVNQDISTPEFIKFIEPFCISTEIHPKLYWLTDNSCFVLWEQSSTLTPTELQQQAENLLEMIHPELENTKMAMMCDLAFVTNNGLVLFDDGTFQSIKKRKVAKRNESGYGRESWKINITSWRNYGINIVN
ncbi:Transcriptional repressor NF-X1 [Boothiomyces sp. JEL0838]|nr:Transcriptional repressor NF-X1 [Boothiomyces sp. JEL0838]